MIKIKYLSVGPNAEHEQVTQLIFDYCDGTYIETNQVELRGYTTVDAECIDGSESLQWSSAHVLQIAGVQIVSSTVESNCIKVRAAIVPLTASIDVVKH